MNEQLKLFAEHLDDKIKLKGIWEMMDGVILKNGLEQGYKALAKKYPDVAKELLELIEAYLQADKLEMVEEASDLFGKIVIVIFFNKSVKNK